MTALNKTVLIVDDEFLITKLLTVYVEEMGLDVCGTAPDADTAIRLAHEHRPAVVLMDMRLQGDKDGVDAALEIYEHLGSKVIFITGSSEPSTIDRIRLDHPSAVLFKPVSERQVRAAIEAAMRG
jgi:DNA-binding NarL/FixJ family response regulator